jgi:hypothetical protein
MVFSERALQQLRQLGAPLSATVGVDVANVAMEANPCQLMLMRLLVDPNVLVYRSIRESPDMSMSQYAMKSKD